MARVSKAIPPTKQPLVKSLHPRPDAPWRACDRLLRLTRKMFHGYPNLRRWEQTDDVFRNSMVRLHRAMAEVQVESVRHFFNLAAVQVRRELLDLAKHHFGPEGGGANHHTDGQPADDEGGRLHQNAEEPFG